MTTEDNSTPWRQFEKSPAIVVSERGGTVCVCAPPNEEEKASLIVSAVNERDALVAFHNAWLESEVASATGDPELAGAKRSALIAAHKAVAALEKANG